MTEAIHGLDNNLSHNDFAHARKVAEYMQNVNLVTLRYQESDKALTGIYSVVIDVDGTQSEVYIEDPLADLSIKLALAQAENRRLSNVENDYEHLFEELHLIEGVNRELIQENAVLKRENASIKKFKAANFLEEKRGLQNEISTLNQQLGEKEEYIARLEKEVAMERSKNTGITKELEQHKTDNKSVCKSLKNVLQVIDVPANTPREDIKIVAEEKLAKVKESGREQGYAELINVFSGAGFDIMALTIKDIYGNDDIIKLASEYYEIQKRLNELKLKEDSKGNLNSKYVREWNRNVNRENEIISILEVYIKKHTVSHLIE